MASRAWIIPAPQTAMYRGPRFTFIVEGILFPGCFARLSNGKSWGSRSAARKAAIREGYTIVEGECELRPITQGDMDAYHRRSAMRKDALAVWSDEYRKNFPISVEVGSQLDPAIAAMPLRPEYFASR